MPSEVITMDDLKAIEEKKKQGGGLRGKQEVFKIHNKDEAKAILEDKIITQENIGDYLQLFKDPKQNATTRREIIKRLWLLGRYDVSVKDSEEDTIKKLRKYIEDFTPFEQYINSGNKNILYPPNNKNIPENDKLTFKQILDTINGKPSKMLTQIKEIDFNDPATINKVAREITGITPSKKPTEPPVVSPTENLDDQIKQTASLIKDLNDKLKKTTDATDITDLSNQILEEQKYLVKLTEEKKKGSNPTGNVRTKVAEIEKKKEKTEEEKEDEKEEEPQRPPRMTEPPTTPATAPPLPAAPAPAPAPAPPPAQPRAAQPRPVQPPPVPRPVQPPPVINPYELFTTPPTSPRTATATATTTTKQDQEKGRPQDPTAIDTMQPLPSKSDLIPEARLGTKGKDINDLIDDIKYFMDNFEGQLKREKGFFKNVDIRNIKELRELHDRIVGKLAPEKQKSTDGNKVGIIVNADDYIREQMKKILQEQTFSSLRPADVVIDVGSRAVEGRDAKDFGDFEVKRTIDGGLSSQREAVYRYMPSENDTGEEVEESLTRKKKSNRIKMPKPGLNNKRTTAIRMNTRNPFRGSQNTIKLKYLY